MADLAPLPDSVVDALAPLVHEAYLERQRESGLDPDRPTHRPWEELSDELRARSRAQVQGYPELLAVASLRIVHKADWEGAVLASLPQDIVEQLACHEHDRWMSFEIATNPDHGDLRMWGELDEPTKEKDRAPIRALPRLLARVGFIVVRD